MQYITIKFLTQFSEKPTELGIIITYIFQMRKQSQSGLSNLPKPV